MASQENETAKRLRLAQHIANKYQHINGVDSVAVGGSTAIGSAYSGSDLDMWVTYSELPNHQQTNNAICQLVEEHGNEPQPTYLTQGHVNSFRLEGVDVAVQLGPNEAVLQLPHKIDSMVGTPYIAEYYYMAIFHDPKGVWRPIKDTLACYPETIGARIIETQLEESIRILKDKMPKAMATQNVLHASELQIENLDRFLRLLFALNKCYYKRLLDVKALFPRLTITPDDCFERLETCANERSPRKVRELMLGLVQDVLPLIPSVYPDVDIGLHSRQLGLIAQIQV